jgi:hypothetical protein
MLYRITPLNEPHPLNYQRGNYDNYEYSNTYTYTYS